MSGCGRRGVRRAGEAEGRRWEGPPGATRGAGGGVGPASGREEEDDRSPGLGAPGVRPREGNGGNVGAVLPGDPGMEPKSPTLAGGFVTTESPGKPTLTVITTNKNK